MGYFWGFCKLGVDLVGWAWDRLGVSSTKKDNTMSQFMSVEISANQIADVMLEDANFAFEVWFELAERMHMGMMADDLGDMIASCGDREKAKWIVHQFKDTFATIDRLNFANP